MKLYKAAILILACGSAISCGKKTDSTGADLTVLSLPMSGTWTGPGSETSNGHTLSCSSISVTLTFTASTLTISNFNSVCSGSTSSQSTLTVSTANGTLSYNGVALGTISDNDVHIHYSTTQGINYDAEFSLQDATHLTYTENDSDNSGDSFSGTATLTKQ